MENIIEDKNLFLKKLTEENHKLKDLLDGYARYEVKQKIRIEEGYLPTVIGIFQQLRELELPNDRLLLRCDHKAVYAKMIAKYFSHGEREIPIETARNYFVEVKNDIPAKGTVVYPDQQLFKLVSKT